MRAPMGILTAALVGVALGPSIQAAADDPYTLDRVIPITGPTNRHGIAWDGAEWHIASSLSGYFADYDAGFTSLGTTSVAGVSAMRGLTYAPSSNTLFVADFNSRKVMEVDLAGNVLGQFTSTDVLNALAYDTSDDTLWLLSFGGHVQHRTRSGQLLGDDSIGALTWTGMAYNSTADTLILLSAVDDLLFEYDTSLNLLRTLVSTDQMSGNGQGLFYDATDGSIYATVQDGDVHVFTPEPGALLLLALGGLAMIRRRRR